MNTDNAGPSAYIRHQIPGRVRLKIPEKKGDLGYFAELAEGFAGYQTITRLELNPVSASVLICHELSDDFLNIAGFAQQKGLFSIIDKPEEIFNFPKKPVTYFASAGVAKIDKSLSDFTRGLMDGRSLLFLALIGLAVRQMSKEHVLGASTSLLWYAFRVLNGANSDSIESEVLDDGG